MLQAEPNTTNRLYYLKTDGYIALTLTLAVKFEFECVDFGLRQSIHHPGYQHISS